MNFNDVTVTIPGNGAKNNVVLSVSKINKPLAIERTLAG